MLISMGSGVEFVGALDFSSPGCSRLDTMFVGNCIEQRTDRTIGALKIDLPARNNDTNPDRILSVFAQD